jgi:protein O-GlcNAc transferase
MNRKQRRAAAAMPQIPSRRPDPLVEGLRRQQAGRLLEAEACYEQALAEQPGRAEALNLRGVLALNMGKHALALDSLSRAAHAAPRNADYLYNFGVVLSEQSRFDEAMEVYRRVLALQPDYAAAYANLGLALAERGRLDEAIAAYHKAIASRPNYAIAQANLGNAFWEQGRLEEAVAASRRAIEIDPEHAPAYSNLGAALADQGKLEEAVAAHRRAIALKPEFAAAHSNLGSALAGQGKVQEAIEACRRALAIAPNFAAAHFNLGTALIELGEPAEAIASFGRAIAIKPDFLGPYSNLAYCINLFEGPIADELTAHRACASALSRSARGAGTRYSPRENGGRLRIGYVSPDFRQHSVAYFFEPLLMAHDRRAVEVFCYADVSSPDATTARLKARADHWRDALGMSDDALAERIRVDGIDILVDLAGHTAKNRLGAFARRPAPIQATWLGYPNTTGLSSIDYRLVDELTDPVGEADTHASERLLRLDGGFLCYGGAPNAPEPAPPPSATSGIVTFGSFNNPPKLSPRLLDTWASLLTRMPQARLLLKGKAFRDPATRDLLLSRLTQRGIAADRVELVAWLPNAAAHLDLYSRIDVALDPFPYNGTTTTCEALWMGVPVVTLRGDRHRARVGASLLTQLGLTDWIADSSRGYQDIAIRLASDARALAELRASLRARMQASPLCDGAAFARKMEAAYREMLRRWRETNAAAASAAASNLTVDA